MSRCLEIGIWPAGTRHQHPHDEDDSASMDESSHGLPDSSESSTVLPPLKICPQRSIDDLSNTDSFCFCFFPNQLNIATLDMVRLARSVPRYTRVYLLQSAIP